MSDEETYSRFSLLLGPDETIEEEPEPEQVVPNGYVRADPPKVTVDTSSEWGGVDLLEAKYMDAINSFESQNWSDAMSLLDMDRATSIRQEPTTTTASGGEFQKQTNFQVEAFRPTDGIGRVSFVLQAAVIPQSVEFQVFDSTREPPGNYFFINDDGEGSLLIQQKVWLNEQRTTEALDCVGKVDYTFGNAEIYLGLLPPVQYMQARFRVKESVTSMMLR